MSPSCNAATKIVMVTSPIMQSERGENNMRVNKKVTKSGAITIPRSIQRETGILPNSAVDIITDEEGIHILKHTPTCNFCGAVEEVKKVCGIEICKECAMKIQIQIREEF